MSAPFGLITSIRFDPALVAAHSDPAFKHAGWNFRRASPCYALDLHRDRIVRAARHWGWEGVVRALSGDEGLGMLGRLVEAEGRGKGGDGPRRVRVLVNEAAEFQVESAPEKERALGMLFPAGLAAPGEEAAGGEAWDVVMDGAGTARSEYTHYKTTRRDMYDAARARMEVRAGEAREVLVGGEDDVVMEGSITTPYFWRGARWVTPKVGATFGSDGCGGQDGTTRRWALENGIAVEGVVDVDSLEDGELIWLSNGAKGFVEGRFRA